MSGASAVGGSGSASPVGLNTPVVGGSVPAIQESQGGGKGAAQSPMNTQQPQINPYQNSSYTQMFSNSMAMPGASANTRYVPKQYGGSGATAITPGTATTGPLGQSSGFPQGNYGGGIDFGGNNTTSNSSGYITGIPNALWGQAPSPVTDLSGYSGSVGSNSDSDGSEGSTNPGGGGISGYGGGTY